MSNKYCLLTADVETHSILFNELRDDTGYKVYKYAMPQVLELYRKFNVNATFFFTGYIANLIPDVVRMIIADGHEVGCHGLVHDVDKAFDTLSLDQQVNHLTKAKNILEEISQKEVISFRAPALRVNENTPVALSKAGFKIDSSVSPQRFDLFLSFGSKKKFSRVFSPRSPYFTDQNNLSKRGKGPVLEVPLSSLLLPFVGSTMRAFPNANKIMRNLLYLESKANHNPIVTYFHPNEFIDETIQEGYKIPRRSNNYLEYIFADVVRRKLKLRNLGSAALRLYSDQIKYFAERDFKFLTIKQFSEQMNLLK